MAVEEFIHRFLQHVLPKGFVKVRYYGFLSAGQRAQLTTIRQQLGATTTDSSSAQAASATETPVPTADPAATTAHQSEMDLPRLAPSALPSPSDTDAAPCTRLPVGGVGPAGYDEQSMASGPTPQREVRCPACGRRLLQASILLPTGGHPP